MNEKYIEKKLREKVNTAGGIAIKFYSSAVTGVPDRIVLMPGARIWFVEVKTAGKKPNSRQLFVHELLRKLGFEVWIIDSNELLNSFLKVIQ